MKKLSSAEIIKKLKKQLKKLKSGDKFHSEAMLCNEYSISRMTANKIINSLVTEGFLYRIKGSGTYVQSTDIKDEPIKFLLPCQEYFVYDCTYPLQQILGGMVLEARKNKIRIEGIPVSKVNNPENIDFSQLASFNEDTKVVVCGSWFKNAIPFLEKKNCKIIYTDFSGKAIPDWAENYDSWLKFNFNIKDAMVDSVMYLAEKGFSKIGYVYANYFQDAPQNIGYKEGLKKAGLEFEPTINLYIHNSDWFFERLLNNHNDFDALIVESHMQIKQTMFLLEKSGRRIPDDIGVMVIGDHEKLQYYTPPITALATPHHECGKKIIKSIIKDKIESKTIDLTAKIFERDSTQKGIGSAPNPAFNIAPQAEANFYL